MIEILSSKYTSLVCAVLNTAMAVSCMTNGQWGWFLLTAGLAGYCYRNYARKSDGV